VYIVSILPKSTLAAILVEQKQPLEVVEIQLPPTLGIGQVLVEFAYSGICGSQIGEIDGVKGPDRWLPHLLGHEASGKVLSIGPGVTHVQPGDIVVAHWRPSLGIEASPAKYDWNGMTVNAGWVTTFNRHAIVSENRLTVIPANCELQTAALFGCAVTTGFGTVDNKAKVRLGERVVVFGAGGIGLNILQAAALAGASCVIAIDLFDNRLKLASHSGATETINAASQDAWARLAEIFATRGPDVFIDNTGNPAVISRGYELVHSRGRVVLVGVPKKGASSSVYTLPLHFGKELTGTTGGEAMPHEDIPRYLGLIAARRIQLNDLVTEVASLRDVNRLIQGMRDGSSAGRCLINFNL